MTGAAPTRTSRRSRGSACRPSGGCAAGRAGDRRHGFGRDRARDPEENGIRPWLKRYRRIPPKANGDLVAAMEDVPERCRRDSAEDGAPVRMDGTSRRRTGETRVPRQARPGDPAIHDLEHGRNGTATPFMPFAPPRGFGATRKTKRVGERVNEYRKP